MDRHQILQLMQVRDYPAVSILCPTHRTSPDNRRDPILLKALIREARNRLVAEFGKREAEPIIARVEALADEVDHTYNLDGLAIFVSRDVGELHRLSYTVDPRVVIDETFATRDLIYALNRSQRYRALLLDPSRTRLFEGSGSRIVEVEDDDLFPIEPDDQPTRSADAWWGINPDSVHDARRRRFAREVADALHQIHERDPLPIVLIGSDMWIPIFKSATRHRSAIIGTVSGQFPNISRSELAGKVGPIVAEWRAREREKLLADLDDAVSANRYASGVDQVWRQVQRGMGTALLVEEGYRQPARIQGEGLILEWAEDIEAPDVVDDIVDEIVEGVIERGGRVLFYPDGSLEEHQRIALITRHRGGEPPR